MAKYNAVTHTIESDNGMTLLATLTPAVRADEAFQIADAWKSRPVEDYEMLEEDLSVQQQATDEARSYADSYERLYHNADLDLTKAQARIEELEAEIAELKQKGEPTA